VEELREGTAAGFGSGWLQPTVSGEAWTETVLYTFESSSNGKHPTSVAIQRGNLVGTTREGGTSKACGAQGCGVLFQLAS
jgi:hypothetical protein